MFSKDVIESGSSGAIIIFRMGSIGDTMVALPSLRVVQRAFPHHQRILLTEGPSPHQVVMGTLLEGSDIIHGVIDYPLGERHPLALWKLGCRIRAVGAKTLVYLTYPRPLLSVYRDLAFFLACGIRHIIGAPLTSDLRQYRFLPQTGLYESEAARMARTIAKLGDARLSDEATWRLPISASDTARADAILDAWPGNARFIAVSAGAKVAKKDWGETNWHEHLRRLGVLYPDLGLLLTGGNEDRAISERLARAWNGPVLTNLGEPLQLFQSMVRRARFFLGIDSGPMHLAAAMGVPVVALFSARDLPGVWYPAGKGHTILRHNPLCAGCQARRCQQDNICMKDITVDSVLAACCRRLDGEDEDTRSVMP